MNRHLKIICLLLVIIGCRANKDAFVTAFGLEKSPDIVRLNEKLTTSSDTTQILFYGKYSGSQEAFRALAIRLNLKKAANGTGPILASALSLEWWSPPSLEAQLSNDERYYYLDSGVENKRPTQEIVMLYTNGVIYVFKNGYAGERGR